jgi:hypothetical protein
VIDAIRDSRAMHAGYQLLEQIRVPSGVVNQDEMKTYGQGFSEYIVYTTWIHHFSLELAHWSATTAATTSERWSENPSLGSLFIKYTFTFQSVLFNGSFTQWNVTSKILNEANESHLLFSGTWLGKIHNSI